MTNETTVPAGHPNVAWDLDNGHHLRSYGELEEVLRRTRDFSIQATKRESLEFTEGTLVALDGRPHLNRRKALTRMLSPKMPWGAEGRAFDEAFDHYMKLTIESAAPGATEVRFDMLAFAAGVYWRLMAGMIGIDQVETEEDIEQFRELAGAVVTGLSIEYAPEAEKDALLVKARAAVARLRETAYVPSFERRLRLVRDAVGDVEKKNALPGDLITSLLAVQEDLANIDDTLIFREMVELMAGSVNNPVAMAAYALDDIVPWLDQHPEARAKLGDRAFLNAAVAESLRLHRATRPYLARVAQTDIVLTSGREIKKGEWVYGWLGASDRDPEVFGSDRDEYKPGRNVDDEKVPSWGLAFGAGSHLCLGRPILVWDQGGNDAQGVLVKMLRKQLEHGIKPDPNGIQEEFTGPEGGTRYIRYDVVMPLESAEEETEFPDDAGNA
ncbi:MULTISPECIES: cytochrome P450 [Actinomycetes]|uniref:cytochrome P450 n=1 Tax=Actinomycetes TaxID=1760 RepID=UPI000AD0176F|nr:MULTISPECIES: cytochrome P450 [Actinomycetes]